MRKQFFSILFAVCLLAVFVAAPAQAQFPGIPIRATIPFDFTVRGKILPAGRYEFSRINDGPGGLIAFNRDNHRHVMFETEPVQRSRTANRGELVFHRYGDTYFLYEIWNSGENEGRELARSRAERRLEREMAQNNAQPQLVAVAIN
jgi:hypothetical protein